MKYIDDQTFPVTIDTFELGTYVVVSGVSFVDELDTTAMVSFRSRYDSLGEGLAMGADEVDVDEHNRLFRLFLSSFSYDFRLVDQIDEGKKFIDEQIYQPSACYALPRKSRSSVGYHIGPIPGSDILVLDKTNITNAETLKIRRTLTKNFYNTIAYKYEQYVLDPDRYLRGFVDQDATSKGRIPVGNKTKIIASSGMREALLGDSLAQTASQRMLNRYKYGSEFIENMAIFYSDGFNTEVGDIVLLNGDDLKIADINSGTRNFEPRLFEVTNKSLDIKTGAVKVTLTDTNFSGSSRYAIIAVSSLIKSGASQTKFVIETDGLFSQFGINEYKFWTKYNLPQVIVRRPDSSIKSPAVQITGISANTITVGDPLGFVPQEGDYMEIGFYDQVTSEMHLVYACMTDNPTFGDSSNQYVML